MGLVSMKITNMPPCRLTFILGTFQIVFDVSGPSARDLDFVYFSGDKIHEMIGWIIDKRILNDLWLGGDVTNGFAENIDYITNPTVRHEEEFRKSSSISLSSAGVTGTSSSIAPSSTFFSL